MWRNWNPCALLVSVYRGTVAVENTVTVLQEIKNRITICFSNSTFEHISKSVEIWAFKRYISIPCVHSITIYKS